jgi:hypothetical protein
MEQAPQSNQQPSINDNLISKQNEHKPTRNNKMSDNEQEKVTISVTEDSSGDNHKDVVEEPEEEVEEETQQSK